MEDEACYNALEKLMGDELKKRVMSSQMGSNVRGSEISRIVRSETANLVRTKNFSDNNLMRLEKNVGLKLMHKGREEGDKNSELGSKLSKFTTRTARTEKSEILMKQMRDKIRGERGEERKGEGGEIEEERNFLSACKSYGWKMLESFGAYQAEMERVANDRRIKSSQGRLRVELDRQILLKKEREKRDKEETANDGVRVREQSQEYLLEREKEKEERMRAFQHEKKIREAMLQAEREKTLEEIERRKKEDKIVREKMERDNELERRKNEKKKLYEICLAKKAHQENLHQLHLKKETERRERELDSKQIQASLEFDARTVARQEEMKKAGEKKRSELLERMHQQMMVVKEENASRDALRTMQQREEKERRELQETIVRNGERSQKVLELKEFLMDQVHQKKLAGERRKSAEAKLERLQSHQNLISFHQELDMQKKEKLDKRSHYANELRNQIHQKSLQQKKHTDMQKNEILMNSELLKYIKNKIKHQSLVPVKPHDDKVALIKKFYPNYEDANDASPANSASETPRAL